MAKRALPDRVSGVYGILHAASGKRYIGSAQNIRRRFSAHRYLLRKGNHHSLRLQAAWDEHGPEAFEWVIIETVPDPEMLINREQHWMDHHEACMTGFNLYPNAANPRGYKWSDEAKAAISTARKGRSLGPMSTEHRAKLSAAAVGRKHTPAARAMMSLQRTGKPRSESARANIRAMLTERNKTPEMRAIAAKSGAASKGRKHTPEARAKMSVDRKGKIKTPEHLAAIKAAKEKRAGRL
jgi:group I intron endonuclease